MNEQIDILGPNAVGAARLPPPVPQSRPKINPIQSQPPAASSRPARLVGSQANWGWPRAQPPSVKPAPTAAPTVPPNAATNPARLLPQPPPPGSVKPRAAVQDAAAMAKRFAPDAPPLPGNEPPKPLADRAKDFVSKIGSKVAAPAKAIGRVLSPISAITTTPSTAYAISREAFRQGVEKGAHPIPADDKVGRDNSIVGRAVQALDRKSKTLPDSPEVQQRNAVVKPSIPQETKPDGPLVPKHNPVTTSIIPVPPKTPAAQAPAQAAPAPAAQAPTPAPAPTPPAKKAEEKPAPGPGATTPPEQNDPRRTAATAAANRVAMAPKPPASEKKSSGDRPIPGSEGGSFAGQAPWVRAAYSGGGNG